MTDNDCIVPIVMRFQIINVDFTFWVLNTLKSCEAHLLWVWLADFARRELPLVVLGFSDWSCFWLLLLLLLLKVFKINFLVLLNDFSIFKLTAISRFILGFIYLGGFNFEVSILQLLTSPLCSSVARILMSIKS